ncbi:hypothetical protein RB628_28755 [Streptomyces sp. ADMS]|uniref:hypothetical protein n=1 Tax=Streptomyces sp. ADMS TaxID=3071415 RepID=UPI00296F6D5C|nr:hypothetical protein [Streptomyces sp. ADMS]MDW4909223.1 hypothetical protein [Streptomyces sp. ADMS]
MTTIQAPQPAAPSPAPPEVHVHRFSPRADGSVLALFTGSRADQAVAAHAADLAARTDHPVTAAAVVVRSTGFSINALLHHARSRRIHAETDAILAPVLPVIARAGPARTTTLVAPAHINPYRSLPVDRVERLAERAGTEVAVSPVTLTGYTSPIARHLRPAAAGPRLTADRADRSRRGALLGGSAEQGRS